MVRFKVYNLFGTNSELLVSIPIWFDLKKLAKSTILKLKSFNSYMVRFKVVVDFDTSSDFVRFQFLYGSI